MIKHLVISGGGPTGFLTLGAAKFLEEHNIWNINDIKTIFGTSIGAFIGVVISLKLEWNELIDYFVERPWENVFDSFDIIEIWKSKGIYNSKTILETLKPLLLAKNIPLDITLQAFYEYNNIDFHFMTSNINEHPIKTYDISHNTYPNLSLIDAISMTTSLIPIFQPVFCENKCFIDGGVLCNFPLKNCLEYTKCNENEVLAFKNNWAINKTDTISKDTNFVDFWSFFIKIILKQLDTQIEQPVIQNIVHCIVDDIRFSDWRKFIHEKEMRIKWIKKGEESGFLFKSYISQYNDQKENH